MKYALAVGLFAGVVLGPGVAPARAVEPAEVNRAIERGVEALRRIQGADGKWQHYQIGATALAGLTLLECGATADDKAVQRAADAVRQASLKITQTYSVSLSILFLDRLGDPADVPLIESLMVRLLAGQAAEGGWSYECPAISEAEVRRLQGKLNARKELVGRREPPKPGPRRTVKDLPEEIQQQLMVIERAPAAGAGGGMIVGAVGDNSNTQFASLALWVGRRHGLPVERAVTRLAAHFRKSQLAEGGWSYVTMLQVSPEAQALVGGMPGMGATASMTCAGLLGLAIADGATLEYIKERKPDARLPDVGKDENIVKGLLALSAVIDSPRPRPMGPGIAPRPADDGVGGRTYYFLWSLERVAVALGLDTIGKKDWYGWGAELLLANQQPDGTWAGSYTEGGADTCFALLFLKRANLARDLTAHLKGHMKDPGLREIKAGGIGGGSLRGVRSRLKSGIESREARPITKPLQDAKPADPETARLSAALVKADGGRRAELLEEMRDEKGPQYTEALAAAIPRLEGDAHRQARDALAQRLTRMKAKVLLEYLQDEDTEIRRAAALAVAMKESKELIGSLIPLLRDAEPTVVRAAHAALKSLTNEDFGPAAGASREDCDRAALKWLGWYSKRKK